MTQCPACSSHDYSKYLISEDLNQRKSTEKFTYYRCAECFSIFILPVPINLSIYYDQDYPAYSVNKKKREELLIDRLERSKLELIRRHAPTGRLIEVGPASGRFLKIAADGGYDVSGIEQDTRCVSYIRNRLNINVVLSNDPASELVNINSVCDIIVAWHVIEHLSNPRRFVAAISKALHMPNGLVFISAPNPSALSFKFFRRFWVHLDAPRHLILMPPEALDKLMRAHGLVRVDCISNDPIGRHLNKIGWTCSMMNLSRNKGIRWALLAWVGRMLYLLMMPVERVHGRGATYTAIYKKTDAMCQAD